MKLRSNQRCGVGTWDVSGNRRIRGWITVAEAVDAGWSLENIERWDSQARNGHGNPLLTDAGELYFLVPPGFFAYDRRRAWGLEYWNPWKCAINYGDGLEPREDVDDDFQGDIPGEIADIR